MSAPQRVIVIGAASTIAMHACRELAARGASMALLARNQQRLDDIAQDLRVRGAGSIFTRALDLDAAQNPAEALREADAALGGADAIGIFYGFLGEQARAEHDAAEAAKIMSVNFTSAAFWALASADLLEPRNGSVLLGISSVAADRGRRSNYIYGAAKSGFAVLMQGIAHRMAAKPGGPSARVLKFGFVDSAMTEGIKKGGPLWTSAQNAGRLVVRAFEQSGPIIYAPWYWRWIMLIIRCMPSALFNRVNL